MTFERKWLISTDFCGKKDVSPLQSKSKWKYIKPLSSLKLAETRKYLYLPYNKGPLIMCLPYFEAKLLWKAGVRFDLSKSFLDLLLFFRKVNCPESVRKVFFVFYVVNFC